MWHCWCLCAQLQVLTVSDRSLIYIIGGLVINGYGVLEDPIKIWSEIWSSPLLLCYLSPAALAHWKWLGFLSSYFMIKYQNFFKVQNFSHSFFHVLGCFTVLPLRGSKKTGSYSSDTRTQSYSERLSHYLLSSKGNNTELCMSRLLWNKNTYPILVCKHLFIKTIYILIDFQLKAVW